MPRAVRALLGAWMQLDARRKFHVRWISRLEIHSHESALLEFAAKVLVPQTRGLSRDSLPTELLEVLRAWWSEDIDHRQASQACREIAERVNVSHIDRFQLENWERICQTFGLHVAAGAFAQRAYERVDLEASFLKTAPALERQLVSALHWADLEKASSALSELKSRRLNRSQIARAYLYEAYLGMATGATGPNSIVDVSSRFFSAVHSKRVLVYGPGEVDSVSSTLPPCDLVARTSGLGKYVFDNDGDLVNNQTDIVYTNPEVFEWGTESFQAEAARLLGQFSFVVTKKRGFSEFTNNRVATNLGPLFLRGHPNKGPLMVLDLLFHRPKSVHVIGMSFFLAKKAYRTDSVGIVSLLGWADSAPTKKNLNGSEGAPFTVNCGYASHNSRENFALIKNLYVAGAITGDHAFSRVMKLTVSQYLEELDEVAGKERL